jgi:hypothetical protein
MDLRPPILPRPFLESRQSKRKIHKSGRKFCRARFWNQGKATLVAGLGRFNFAAPVFGIKAKLPIARAMVGRNFAAPVFGIKAKRNAGRE